MVVGRMLRMNIPNSRFEQDIFLAIPETGEASKGKEKVVIHHDVQHQTRGERQSKQTLTRLINEKQH